MLETNIKTQNHSGDEFWSNLKPFSDPLIKRAVKHFMQGLNSVIYDYIRLHLNFIRITRKSFQANRIT